MVVTLKSLALPITSNTLKESYMPITEEMLVEFIIEHGVTCAEDLDDLSHLIHLIRAEADTPCMAMWTEEVTVH